MASFCEWFGSKLQECIIIYIGEERALSARESLRRTEQPRTFPVWGLIGSRSFQAHGPLPWADLLLPRWGVGLGM